MPRKTATRKSESSNSEHTELPTQTKTKTQTKVKKVKAPSNNATPSPTEAPVSDVTPDAVSDVTPDVVSDVESEAGVKSRQQPTKESVVDSFDDLVLSIEAEIVRLRETAQTKTRGVKFLRSLGKRVKTLRGQTTRVMKQRVRTNRKNNNNSGFLKPVKISKDMAKFTGWDPEQLKSRVDVTKYVCNYIRENNLQNPTDRRQILADSKLSKLLKYDSKTSSEPLTYYRIQTHLKPHFLKTESA